MDQYGREEFGRDEFSRQPQAPSDVYRVVRPLFDAKGWMRFLGILSIIWGALMCLTIVGAIIGWLPIWMGVLLMRAAGNVEGGFTGQDPRAIHDGLESLRLHFKIQGILQIIGLIFMMLYFVVIIAVIATGGMNF